MVFRAHSNLSVISISIKTLATVRLEGERDGVNENTNIGHVEDSGQLGVLFRIIIYFLWPEAHQLD